MGLAIALLAIPGPPLIAQPSLAVSLEAGYHLDTGNLVTAPAVTPSLRIGTRLSPLLEAFLYTSYRRASSHDSHGSLLHDDVDVHQRHLFAGLSLGLVRSQAIQPFLESGLGPVFTTRNEQWLLYGERPAATHESDAAFGLLVGAGTAISVAPRISVALGARYTSVPSRDDASSLCLYLGASYEFWRR